MSGASVLAGVVVSFGRRQLLHQFFDLRLHEKHAFESQLGNKRRRAQRRIFPVVMPRRPAGLNINTCYRLQVVTVRIFFKFVVAVLNVAIAAQKSKGFFGLIEKFQRFDTITLQVQCPSDMRVQTFYLTYTLSIEVFYLVISVYYTDTNIIILIIWILVPASTTFMINQYVIFVRLLRERYKLANNLFSSSEYL